MSRQGQWCSGDLSGVRNFSAAPAAEFEQCLSLLFFSFVYKVGLLHDLQMSCDECDKNVTFALKN